MIVVDSGVLYAAADVRDSDHARCSRFTSEHTDGSLIVPASVVVETAQLIQNRLGSRAETGFARQVAARMNVIDLDDAGYARVVELLETYEDLRLGFVDASVVATAERLQVTTLASLNRRDFLVVRPSHVPAFELVP